jgi:solute carrier family 25 protein 42
MASSSSKRDDDDDDDDEAPEPFAWERLLAGGAAGALSRVATAPIDRVKILFQVNAASSSVVSTRSALLAGRAIVKEEGVTALWRGTGAAVTRILPYSATTFAVFPVYNAALARAMGEPEGGGILTRFVAGALAGTTATIMTYPLDLLHARSAAHVTGPGAKAAANAWMRATNRASAASAASSSSAAASASSAAAPLGLAGSVRHLTATVNAGGVKALYAGLGPTLMGIVPYGGISFATFETLKAAYRKKKSLAAGGGAGAADHDWDPDEMPVLHKLAAGAVAGLIAQTATYPLHIVRRRMQVHGAGAYPSVVEGLKEIYVREGVANGLFKGVGLTWVKGPVAAAIGFTANDVLKLAVPAARKTLIAGAKDAPTPTPATYIESKSATAVESLIAGGTAGAIAKSVIAPADRVKIMYQVDPNRPFSLSAAVKTAKDIVRTEGVLGLWRGNGVMMARVIPYAGVSFLTFPKYEAAVKAALGKIFGEPDGGGDAESGSRIAIRFVAGSAAGATATTMTYPLDLLRARYAAHGTGTTAAVAVAATATGGAASGKSAAAAAARARGASVVGQGAGAGAAAAATTATRAPVFNIFRDVSRVVAAEGVRGLYGGITPTLLGIVPYAGISFATFETLKGRYLDRERAKAAARGEAFDETNPTMQMPVATRLLFGGVAGLFAQSVTYPLDIVRRRIQVMGRAGMGNASLWGTIVDIAKTEGFRGGLYKGVSMNWIKGPLSVAVSFYINDSVKAFFRDLHEKHYL